MYQVKLSEWYVNFVLTIQKLQQEWYVKGIIWVVVHTNIDSADYNFVLGDWDPAGIPM